MTIAKRFDEAKNMTPCVTIENIVKFFGSFAALNDVNLEIEQGEFFSLLGSSGCGKSTLLRIIAGLEQPSSGRILIDGVDVTRLAANKRPTNMMFQSYALFPHLTVEKNICFGLRQERLEPAEMQQRLHEVGDKLHLHDLMERKPDKLSGGQKQRVALARALVKRPRVLLLDEPLAALDKNLRSETQHELLRLQRELGITFIIVTHDQEEAMTVSSRLAIMQAGKILQIGAPEDVYERPTSRYIAKFLGETNILKLDKISQEGAFLRLVSGEAGADIFCTMDDQIIQDRLWLSIRPERVELSKKKVESKKSATSGIEAKIEQITYTGLKRNYRLRLKSGAIMDCVRISQAPLDNFLVGEDVFIHWSRDAARLLAE